MTRRANGRHARFYLIPGGDHYVAVTYWGIVRGRRRQLTVSPKLMRRIGVAR